jgi:hypothetical protein
MSICYIPFYYPGLPLSKLTSLTYICCCIRMRLHVLIIEYSIRISALIVVNVVVLVVWGGCNLVSDNVESLVLRDKKKIWQKYCGFLDLSLKEFLDIQEHLLLEQLQLTSGSQLSRIIMKGARPGSINEFRQKAPLTRYEDYRPYIGQQQEEYLAQKPAIWARTSGKGGEAKWVPYTQKALDLVPGMVIASFIMACASYKGEINIGNKIKVMQNLAPPPYFSGVVGETMVRDGCVRAIPPLKEYNDQPFEKRMQAGFNMALRMPVDILASLTAVLIKMGETFSEKQGSLKMSRHLLHPRVLLRLMRAYWISRKENRPILPKDLWPLKGLICYGMDTSAYRQRLKYYWGREPLEVYSSTEAIILALQSWNKKAMTFLPFSGFLELIPEAEWLKNRQNPKYQPKTILIDEVREGGLYEVVFSSFHGMPFIRYRLGDLIKVVGLKDDEAGIQLPQVIFQSRCDDVIDINGFARLDEKTIWQAITGTGVKIVGWSARKEFADDKPFVHIYLESKNEIDTADLGKHIHEQFLKLNRDYYDLQNMLGVLPVKVTKLSPGSFQAYYESKSRAGAELAHFKPPQMNALDRDLEELLVNSN